MIRNRAFYDDSLVHFDTSRRGILRVLGATPVAGALTGWRDTLLDLHRSFGDDPATLVRTKEGRHLSRVRYQRAESFLDSLGRVPRGGLSDTLYYSGIVAQLGLSAHLLDVGFSDEWCARFIGLRVAKGLDYANATGFGHDCADMARLATVLTPYGAWRQPRFKDEPALDDGGFILDNIQPLLRGLLDRAREVTGHARPAARRR